MKTSLYCFEFCTVAKWSVDFTGFYGDKQLSYCVISRGSYSMEVANNRYALHVETVYQPLSKGPYMAICKLASHEQQCARDGRLICMGRARASYLKYQHSFEW